MFDGIKMRVNIIDSRARRNSPEVFFERPARFEGLQCSLDAVAAARNAGGGTFGVRRTDYLPRIAFIKKGPRGRTVMSIDRCTRSWAQSWRFGFRSAQRIPQRASSMS